MALLWSLRAPATISEADADPELIKTNKVSWKTVLNDLEKAFREIK